MGDYRSVYVFYKDLSDTDELVSFKEIYSQGDNRHTPFRWFIYYWLGISENSIRDSQTCLHIREILEMRDDINKVYQFLENIIKHPQRLKKRFVNTPFKGTRFTLHSSLWDEIIEEFLEVFKNFFDDYEHLKEEFIKPLTEMANNIEEYFKEQQEKYPKLTSYEQLTYHIILS